MVPGRLGEIHSRNRELPNHIGPFSGAGTPRWRIRSDLRRRPAFNPCTANMLGLSTETGVNTRNSALIQPEILFEVARVFEGSYPAGPSFLNALGNLVEAIVIHEHIYLYGNKEGLDEDDPDSPWPAFYASRLVTELSRAGILIEPTFQEFSQHLTAVGSEYDFIEFIEDFAWVPTSFVVSEPSFEEGSYRESIDLVRHAAGIFAEETLVKDDIPDSPKISVSALPLIPLGFTKNDLIRLEGRNRMMRGYYNLSKNLGVHLYSLFQSVPHQLGAVRNGNSRARLLFERIQNKALALLETEDLVGDETYTRVSIPPLLQIVLAKCLGSQSSFASELLELRHRHRQLRSYLSSYEEAWQAASTREEARKLNAELATAFESLGKLETAATTRLLYRIWDVVKDPTKILEKVGDALVHRGKEYYAIDRVWGLHDFYHDVRNAPLPRRNYDLLASMFDKMATENTWATAEEFAKLVDRNIVGSKASGGIGAT